MSDEKLSKKSMRNELKSPIVTCLRYDMFGLTHRPGSPHVKYPDAIVLNAVFCAARTRERSEI